MVASFQDTSGKGASAPNRERAPGENPTAGQSAIANAAPPKRTWGLWLVDNFLYTFLTNTAVFAISVGATYLTAMGHLRYNIHTKKLIEPEFIKKTLPGTKEVVYERLSPQAIRETAIEKRFYDPKALETPDSELNKLSKPIYGKFGKFLQWRGAQLIETLETKLGMSYNAADMTKMVAFSFIDGSLMAPVVKKLEDQRESMARWIDRRLGTEPKDDAAYKAEPKQSWGSVLGGRFATVSLVVPTAVLLEKTGWNDKLFSNPGLRTGKWLESAAAPNNSFWGKVSQPLKAPLYKASHVFGQNTQLPYLWKTIIFEAFYTSVCTAGLYITSRFFAGGRKAQEQPQKPLMGGPVPVLIPRAEETVEKEKKQENTPSPKIQEASHFRLKDKALAMDVVS